MIDPTRHRSTTHHGLVRNGVINRWSHNERHDVMALHSSRSQDCGKTIGAFFPVTKGDGLTTRARGRWFDKGFDFAIFLSRQVKDLIDHLKCRGVKCHGIHLSEMLLRHVTLSDFGALLSRNQSWDSDAKLLVRRGAGWP